jgi:hypothetical protein
MTVVTGLRYINPHPMPPNNPQPVYSNSKECKWTPAAVVKRPADQKADPTNPDFRGPTFSTHDPKVDVYDVLVRMEGINSSFETERSMSIKRET